MDIKKRRQTVRRRRVEAFTAPQAQPVKAAQQSSQGPPAFLTQALGHVQAGRLDTAIDLLKQSTQEDPLTVYNNLGRLYLAQKRFDEARDVLQKAFDQTPATTSTAVALAHAMASQHQVSQAVETLLICLRLQHDRPSIRVLTDALVANQAQDAALTAMRTLHDKTPESLDIQFEWARMLRITAHIQEAEQAFLGILERRAHTSVYCELACLYRDTRRPSKVIACLQQAVALNPDQIQLYHHLGTAYCQAGLANQGVATFRQALDKAPDNRVLHSDWLQQSHTLPDATPEALFQAHQEWADRHAPALQETVSHDNRPDPDRVLCIGYLSPDFCEHAVSYFVEPLLEGHHRDKVRVYGYGHVLKPDAVTQRLKGRFDHYCDIVRMDDQAVAERIKQDGIDILVDLAGHTANNRLGVMALKPAPVQVTYLGYPDTTGLSQIDYRITDARAESERSRQCTTETLVDLPRGFLCYRPPEDAPEVTPAPVETNGYVTFGSFNHNAKINKNMIALWSQILLNIPDARLLLKLCTAEDEAVKAMYLECFESYGVTSERIELHTFDTHESYLACLAAVDVALDTFPYHGTTTTCDSLWMGVPVVTLKGDLHCSRTSYSLLSQLGMEFLAVDTPEQYVIMASALACKPEAIVQMRDSMRLRMGASSLLKADAFAGQMETAYRHMWETWCQKT